jgi:hypothetical protein
MTQTARPISDITVGGFRTQTGSGSSLFATLDEAIQDLTDYIYSTDDPDGSAFVEVELGNLSDPLTGDDHFVTVVWTVVGSQSMTLLIELRQGATLIDTQTTAALASGTTYTTTITLLNAEADAISDYTDLRVRIYPSLSGVVNSFTYLTTVDQIRLFGGSNAEYARAVTTMDVVDGQIYPTYGDYNTNTEPGLDLVSVNPSTGVVTQHLTDINTSFFSVKPVGSDIIVPYWDPIANTPGLALRVGGVWAEDASGDVVPPHLFDAVAWDGAWYISGARIDSGTTSSAVVWKSTDSGANWTVDLVMGSSTTLATRIYAFFEYDDRLYVQHALNFSLQTGAAFLDLGNPTWQTTATQRPLSTGSATATSSEVRRFGTRLYWHGTIGGKSFQTNTAEWFPTAITNPTDIQSVPLDRSAANTIRFEDAWTYDITDDGTRMYVLGQDNLLYTSSDGDTFTVVLTGEKLPGGLRSVACVGSDVFLGNHGGQIFRSSAVAWSTTDLLWETFHDDPTTSRGWVKVDASTPQMFFRGSQFIKSAASTTGGSFGVPRLYYNTAFTRAAGLTCEVKVNSIAFANPRFRMGFMQTSGANTASNAQFGFQSATPYIAVPASSAFVQVIDPSAGATMTWPGREYRVVLEATGSVVYSRGFGYPAIYDDREASQGDWFPVGRERTDATASLFAGFTVDGSHQSGVNIDYLRVFSGDAPAKTISDTFTRADSGVTIGSAETGGAYTVTGTWGISSNQGQSLDTSGLATYARIASGIADGLLEVTVTGAGITSEMGLVFRYVDSTNYWRAYYTGVNFVVDRTVASVVTTEYTVADAASSGTIAVTMMQDKIAVHRGTNGVTYGTTITSSVHQSATIHGLMTNQTVTTGRFDNFFLYGPVAG